MHRIDGAFAFAQPRLQARLSERPTAAAWQRLIAARDLEALLRYAGASQFATWTGRLGGAEGVHELELRLRESWVAKVEEVARWLPAEWRPAVRMMRWLPYLGAIDALARGEPPRPWMRADPVLAATLAAASGQPVRRKAGQETAWPMRASDGSAAAPASFAQRWRSTWPAGRRHRDALESVLRLVNVHRAEVAGLPDGSSSEATREHLERRLLSVFRRNPSSPAAAIAWLGLTAIDAARLRGAIVVRAIRDPHGDVP